MTFGEDKCGYIYIERGSIRSQGESIIMNGVTVKELEEGESYRYLGVDENVEYNGKINKERILKEYYRRVKAIWLSELNSRNKTVAHNSFAIPILVPTVGILEWNIKEIEDIDKRTTKILCMSGNFHKNSDVDRLYIKRKDGGRGLKSFEDSFCTRIVGLAKHLERDRYRNHLLQNVFDHEQQRIIRLGKEYEKMYQPEQEEEKNSVCDKTLTKTISNETCKKKKEKWHEKAQHGYIFRKCNEDQNIVKNASNSWLTKGKLSSHIEGYLCSIQEQEIDTRGLRRLRQKDPTRRRDMERKCRMCGKAEENIFHVIASCPYLASNLYLYCRHNPVAKALYQEIIAQVGNQEDANKRNSSEPSQVTKIGEVEIWWDLKIAATSKVPHNRPDMVVWNNQTKSCQVIDVCIPLDTNVELRHGTKRDNYMPLVDSLRRVYPGYRFQVVPVIIGALGTIPTKLKTNLKMIGLTSEAINRFIEHGQKLALLGTLKITKNFQKH